MLRAGVGWSDRYEREASVEPLNVGGEVGEGWFGDGCPGDVDGWEPPFIAARCEEDKTALSAALAGSRACSISDLS